MDCKGDLHFQVVMICSGASPSIASDIPAVVYHDQADGVRIACSCCRGHSQWLLLSPDVEMLYS